MIHSDKEYAITKGELSKLRDALAYAQSEDASAFANRDWLRDVHIDAMESQIATLEAELSHYELLKAGEITFSKTYSLENLPTVLIEARIASGMSQTDLAERLGMKAQQIQRYEASEYSGASLSRVIEVCEALNVRTTGLFKSTDGTKGSVFSWPDVDDLVWAQFPVQEMARRGWFDVPSNSNICEVAREYLMNAAGVQFAIAFNRKKMHGDSVPNEYALLAWQARILERAGMIVEQHNLPEFVDDDRWIADLVSLSRHRNGPKRAQSLLLSKGIVLVTEKHLPGTYLDGGAMLDCEGRPIIGLTLRYDRLDNFWFVLLHEIGHVFLHLLDGLHYDFFDEEEASGDDKIEREADMYALNNLVPEEQWNQCLSRFALTEAAVRIDAKKLGIDASIIAGRIRRERNDYTILNGLVGQGLVATQFEDTSRVLV